MFNAGSIVDLPLPNQDVVAELRKKLDLSELVSGMKVGSIYIDIWD